MNTPEQIAAAEAAAQSVIDANDLEQVDGENPLSALGWAMGEDMGYEDALIRLAAAAIKADREQRAFSMSDPLIELREWASTVSQFMAEDKSNDWSEEIAQLEVIEERLDGVE